MKRIKYLLLCTLFIVLFIPNAKAANISTYVNGTNSIYPDNTIKVSIGVSNAPLLYGFTGKVSYDTSKLTLKNSSGLSGFSILMGEKLTADSASGKSGSFSFVELTFVPSDKFKAGEKTTISFSNVETSDGENTLTCSNSSLTITMNAPKSKNNYLSSLTIDKIDISFDKNKNTYSVIVNNDISNITINAQAEDKNSKVTGTGSKTLNVYENVFNIVVTAESGDTKTYMIIVTRKDENGKTTKPKVETKNPELDDIKIDNYKIDFKKDVYEYSIQLKDDDTKLNIVPVYDKTKYTCDINIPEKFVVGENLIKITLKDKDNNSVVYSIIAFKKEPVKEETKEDTTCKCPTISSSTSDKYKNIVYYENSILFLLLALLVLYKVIKKSKRNKSNSTDTI